MFLLEVILASLHLEHSSQHVSLGGYFGITSPGALFPTCFSRRLFWHHFTWSTLPYMFLLEVILASLHLEHSSQHVSLGGYFVITSPGALFPTCFSWRLFWHHFTWSTLPNMFLLEVILASLHLEHSSQHVSLGGYFGITSPGALFPTCFSRRLFWHHFTWSTLPNMFLLEVILASIHLEHPSLHVSLGGGILALLHLDHPSLHVSLGGYFVITLPGEPFPTCFSRRIF